MPELPDVDTYVVHLQRRIAGACAQAHPAREPISCCGPSSHRCVKPRGEALFAACSRMGKRIVITLEGDLALVIHLMMRGGGSASGSVALKVPGKLGLAAFDFTTGTLLLTEASRQSALLSTSSGERKPCARLMDRGASIR